MSENIYILVPVDGLYHHGIKGQKWGVRRYQNKDGSLTTAGRKRRGSTQSSASKKDDRNASKRKNDRDHSKSDKSPLAIYLTKVGLDVLTLNAVGLVQDSTRLVQAGESFVKSKIYDKERENSQIDKKTGLRLKSQEMTAKQDAERVNPMVHNFDGNTKNNCMLCTSAYDLRRRGYEVRARKASTGYYDKELLAWYPKAKINKVSGLNKNGKPSVGNMIVKLKDELIKQGDGARGNLMIVWSGMRGGHSVAYEVSDGKVSIIDAQIGKIYKNPDTFLYRCTSEVTYARLDNIPFSIKNVKEVAE